MGGRLNILDKKSVGEGQKILILNGGKFFQVVFIEFLGKIKNCRVVVLKQPLQYALKGSIWTNGLISCNRITY